MIRFEFTPPEDDNDNRAYVRVDETFDVSILRTDEGLIVDVYENDAIDLLGTIAIDDDCLSSNRKEAI